MDDSEADTVPNTRVHARKPWSRMLTPAQIDAVMREYDAGVQTAALCRKYKVSRSWLFRTRKRYVEGLDSSESITYLRAEIARLEGIIVAMAKAGFGTDASGVQDILLKDLVAVDPTG